MTKIRSTLAECKTNRERVLWYLFTQGPLTPLHAMIEWQDGHLASRIDELRGEGWYIHTTMRVAANGKRYAEYALDVYDAYRPRHAA